MADVFISYKRENRAVAEALERALREAGFSCWWDTSLVAGEHFNEAIQRELALARCVLVLWTRASHASQWVQAEAIDGFNRRILVAARLDDVALKYPYGIVQTADLRGYRPGVDHAGLEEIVAGVAEKLGRGAPARNSQVRNSPTVKNSRILWISAALAALGLLTLGIARLMPAGEAPREVSKLESAAPQGEEQSTPPSSGPLQERAQASIALRPGETFRDCPNCPEMVVLPAGSFNMGSPDQESGRRGDTGPQRQVSIRAFAVSKYEITFAQWDACLSDGGCGDYRPDDGGLGRHVRAAFRVSWYDAQSYVSWINARAGGQAYRLLSEAEWKYATRAGTSRAYSEPSSAPLDPLAAAIARSAAPPEFHPSMTET